MSQQPAKHTNAKLNSTTRPTEKASKPTKSELPPQPSRPPPKNNPTVPREFNFSRKSERPTAQIAPSSQHPMSRVPPKRTVVVPSATRSPPRLYKPTVPVPFHLHDTKKVLNEVPPAPFSARLVRPKMDITGSNAPPFRYFSSQLCFLRPIQINPSYRQTTSSSQPLNSRKNPPSERTSRPSYSVGSLVRL